MNFMPAEDAFFDEPIVDSNPKYEQTTIITPPSTADYPAILESSLRQEKLLERIVYELERMNDRLIAVERVRSNTGPIVSPQASPTNSSNAVSANKPPRGNLVLPPGSRSVHAPVAEKKAAVSAEEEAQKREKEEQDAIVRRRADEEARLARIEAERIEREAEEERKRQAELKRIEEEKRMKEDLERKTRGLMTGLLTSNGGSLFADDDLDNVVGEKKKSGGLFDD